MRKKLSVAIPTYNRLQYLKECINSVLNQSFQDFSIFVFDNASDEPVEEELEKLADNRIRFIGNNKNVGAEGNLNRILGYPFESEYLSIFHDDDTMHPKMLELQTSFLDAHKEVVFVGSDFKGVPGENIHRFQNFDENEVQYSMYKNGREFLRAWMSWVRCAFDSVMYRVDAIGDSRMKPGRFSDFADSALLVEISQKGPSAFIAAPLLNYRLHSGQYSQVAKKAYGQGSIAFLSFFRDSLPAALSKKDEKLFRAYSVNFLIRSYAHINNGVSDFITFLRRSHKQKLIRYRDFRSIDVRGMVSLVSILGKNKIIIDGVRWMKTWKER